MTGLRGDAAIVGFAEWPTERTYQGPRSFQIEQWAEIAATALADAGIASSEVNGIVALDVRESRDFVPATRSLQSTASRSRGSLTTRSGCFPLTPTKPFDSLSDATTSLCLRSLFGFRFAPGPMGRCCCWTTATACKARLWATWPHSKPPCGTRF